MLDHYGVVDRRFLLGKASKRGAGFSLECSKSCFIGKSDRDIVEKCSDLRISRKIYVPRFSSLFYKLHNSNL